MKSKLSDGIKALRPKQWLKNVLLFVAPFSAGLNSNFDLLKINLGFFAFCLASSIGYIANDLNDLDIDRKHPIKKERPFASGKLSIEFAVFLISMLAVALVFILVLLPKLFGIIVCVYLVNTFIYSKFFKNVPVLEMFLVAFGFVLRLVAGALVLELYISEWFLIVGGFGALFIVCNKRLAELREKENRIVRRVLDEYSFEFLRSSANVCLAVCISSYCLWAFNQSTGEIWYQISVIPFVLAFYRFMWMAEKRSVEAPEDAIVGDGYLRIISIFLIAFLVIAIYT